MAKKNLASLMSGIMGDAPVRNDEQLSVPAGETEKINQKPENLGNEAAPLTNQMREDLEAKRRKNVGRPRKGEVREKVEEIRATFIVNPEHVRKMKYISLVEGNLLKDVIGEALQSYIDAWEKENGSIRLPKKK